MADVVISRLISDLQQPGLMPGLEEERRKMLDLLQAIRPVLSNAAETIRPKSAIFENWIKETEAAAYDADDIVDQFIYAKLQAKVETDRRQGGDNVRTNILSLCKIGGMMPPYKGGMRERLREIVKRFEELHENLTYFIGQEDRWGLLPSPEGRQDPTLSSLNEIEPIIVGRDEERESIVHKLLDLSHHDGQTIHVLSIVGMGGIGKSTLARFVCAHNQIKNNFEYILWVEIGYDFIAPRIAKSVIDQVIGKDCCISEDDMDLLGRRINQELSGKRFLLVLDDVWNMEEWQRLKSLLDQSAATGSSIIVTTRNLDVACLVSSPKGDVHNIMLLDNDDLQTLFHRITLVAEKEKNHPMVFEISRKILKVCGGWPLLVNLMGGLMRFKKEPAMWQQLLEQVSNYSSDYMQYVKLCYDHLPSEIKQCFAFCSVFPSGHYMDKEVLVKLWMANGLFSSNGSMSLEEKGACIFNELALRHFFEDVQLVPASSSRDKHGYHSRVICKMHDLIHELACLASQALKKCHLSVSNDSLIDIPALLENSPHVHTLISVTDPFIRSVNCSVLPESNPLRVLHLHSAKFGTDKFELKYAKHLRCLDLSGSRIKRLPECTSSLYLLQTLDLSGCLLLCELPQEMRYMSNLRHLYVHGCPKLKKMPPHLGQLRSLKTLTTYIIGENAGNGIDEIVGLDLGGLLELYNLSKVKDVRDIKEGDLHSKTKLDRLTLCWGGHRLVMSKANNDLKVLEALQPNNGLKVLKIQQYGDREFATWLANPVGLPNLVELHLFGCPKCETLPAVWKLPSLRVLSLKNMLSLTCIYEDDSSTPFPSLKRLVLVSMKKLERWHNGQAILSFPVLNEMEITHCPELKTMPNVPILKYLTISMENQKQVASFIDLMTQSENLIEVKIVKGIISVSDNETLSELGAQVGGECHKLRVMRMDSTNFFSMDKAIPKNFRVGFWSSLKSLETLDITNCRSLVAWPLEVFRNLTTLKRLCVRMCPDLTGPLASGLQEGKTFLPQLQSLEFYRCLSLEELPRCSSVLYMELDECPQIISVSGFNNLQMLFLSCTSWTSLPTGFEDLKKLVSLRVSECYSLTCLPNELAGLTSLRTLIINKCPRVKSLPKGLDQLLPGLHKFRISECADLAKFCAEEPYSSIISQIGMATGNHEAAGPSTHAEDGAGSSHEELPDDQENRSDKENLSREENDDDHGNRAGSFKNWCCQMIH